MMAFIHLRRLELLLLGTIPAFLPSCVDYCDPPPCETATFSSRLLSGSATLTSGDGTERTFRVGESCNSGFIWTYLRDDVSMTRSVRVLECSSGSNRIAITLNDLGDPRWLSEGKRTSTGEAAGLEVDATWVGPSGTCGAGLTTGSITFDVTQSAGYGRPYPELVTTGYVRRYTVHVEEERALANCVSVSISADFEVEQTQSDIVVNPPSQCRHCM